MQSLKILKPARCIRYNLVNRTRSYTSQHPPHTHHHSSPSASIASASKRPRIKPSVAIATVAASVCFYTVGSLYPPPVATLLSPRAAPGPPDPNLPSSIAYTKDLEAKLQSLPFLVALRSSEESSNWYETRPYVNYPEERRINSLTAGILRGPGKLAVPPLLRVKKDESESVAVVHVGRGLCGHDGIIHGGLLATILDESLARTAMQNLPEKIAVTANLNITYKAPTRADQFVVLRTRIGEVRGRKAMVTGRIEDLTGLLLVEASGTFIQPKYAKLLNTAAIRQIIGEPPDAHILPGSGAPVPAIPPETAVPDIRKE